MRNTVIAVISLALAGCITQATTDLDEMLASRYQGRPLDDFVLNHGPANAEHTLSDGRVAHLWSMGVGQTSVTVGSFNAAAGYGSLTGVEVPLECRVQAVASSDGVIDEISILANTEGVNRITRCGDMLRFD